MLSDINILKQNKKVSGREELSAMSPRGNPKKDKFSVGGIGSGKETVRYKFTEQRALAVPLLIKYEGDLTTDGLKEGIGVAYFQNDTNGNHQSKYCGSWLQDKRHGKGKMEFWTGENLDGLWVEDNLSGPTVITYPNLDQFSGVFEYGKRTGKGTIKYHDLKCEVMCDWSSDYPADKGTVTSKSEEYNGSLIASPIGKFRIRHFSILKHGYGVLINKKENSKFYGFFANGQKKGHGKFVQSNGHMYWGNWKSDQKWGVGIEMMVDGSYYEGNFQNGNRKGTGRLVFPNGDMIEGDFNNDKIDDGKISKGSLEDLPKPVLDFFKSYVNAPMMKESKIFYLGQGKWIDFIRSNLEDFTNQPTKEETELHQLLAQPTANRPTSPLLRVVEQFCDIFNSDFSSRKNINSTQVSRNLTTAVDEINSFVDCLTTELAGTYDYASVVSSRVIKELVMKALFPKIYTTLMALYNAYNYLSDAKIKTKISSMKNTSLSDFGVKPKFLLKPDLQLHLKSTPKYFLEFIATRNDPNASIATFFILDVMQFKDKVTYETALVIYNKYFTQQENSPNLLRLVSEDIVNEVVFVFSFSNHTESHVFDAAMLAMKRHMLPLWEEYLASPLFQSFQDQQLLERRAAAIAQTRVGQQASIGRKQGRAVLLKSSAVTKGGVDSLPVVKPSVVAEVSRRDSANLGKLQGPKRMTQSSANHTWRPHVTDMAAAIASANAQAEREQQQNNSTSAMQQSTGQSGNLPNSGKGQSNASGQANPSALSMPTLPLTDRFKMRGSNYNNPTLPEGQANPNQNPATANMAIPRSPTPPLPSPPTTPTKSATPLQRKRDSYNSPDSDSVSSPATSSPITSGLFFTPPPRNELTRLSPRSMGKNEGGGSNNEGGAAVQQQPGSFPSSAASSSDGGGEFAASRVPMERDPHTNLVQQIGERGSRIEQQRIEREKQKERAEREAQRQERQEREIRLERELSLEREQYQTQPTHHSTQQPLAQQPQFATQPSSPGRPSAQYQPLQRDSAAISPGGPIVGGGLRMSHNNALLNHQQQRLLANNNANASASNAVNGDPNANQPLVRNSSSGSSSSHDHPNNSNATSTNSAVARENEQQSTNNNVASREQVESPREFQPGTPQQAQSAGSILTRPGVVAKQYPALPRVVNSQNEEIKNRLHRINSREVIREMETIFGERRRAFVQTPEQFSPSIIENYSNPNGAVLSTSQVKHLNQEREMLNDTIDSLLNASNNSQSSPAINPSFLASNPSQLQTNPNLLSNPHAPNSAIMSNSHSVTHGDSISPAPSQPLTLNRHSHGQIGQAREMIRASGDGNLVQLAREQREQRERELRERDQGLPQQQHAIREAGVQLVPPSMSHQQREQLLENQSAPVLKRPSQDGRAVANFTNSSVDSDADRERKTLKKKPNIQIKPNEPLVDSLAPVPVQQVNHSPALISLSPAPTPNTQSASGGPSGASTTQGSTPTSGDALVPAPRIGHRSSSECPVIDPRAKLLRPLPGMYLRQSYNPPNSANSSPTSAHTAVPVSNTHPNPNTNLNPNPPSNTSAGGSLNSSSASVDNGGASGTTSQNSSGSALTLSANQLPGQACEKPERSESTNAASHANPNGPPPTSSPVTSPRPFPQRQIGERGMIQSGEDWSEKFQSQLKENNQQQTASKPENSATEQQQQQGRQVVSPLALNKPMPDPSSPNATKTKGTFLSIQQLTKPTTAGGVRDTGDSAPLSPRGKPGNQLSSSTPNLSTTIAQSKSTAAAGDGGNTNQASSTSQHSASTTGSFAPMTPLTPFKKTEASQTPMLPRKMSRYQWQGANNYNGPYFQVVLELTKLDKALTPHEKVNCLNEAGNLILQVVDDYYKDTGEVFSLGAEDKFPILLFCVVHLSPSDTTALFSNIHFLQDFVDDTVGDEQSKYRISEFYNALKNILQLDPKLRDDMGCLIPIKIPKSHVAQCCKDAALIKFQNDADDPDNSVNAAHLMFAVSEIFARISERDENIYAPYLIDKSSHGHIYYLVKHYHDFFQRVFQSDKVGISLQTFQEEPKRGLSVKPEARRSYRLVFVRPYPLYIYLQLSEAASTGEWEERR